MGHKAMGHDCFNAAKDISSPNRYKKHFLLNFLMFLDLESECEIFLFLVYEWLVFS